MATPPHEADLVESVARWHEGHCESALVHVIRDDRVFLGDSRTVAQTDGACLDGLGAMVFRCCDGAMTAQSIQRKLGVEMAELQPVLNRFVEMGWFVRVDGRYLCLSVAMPPIAQVPDRLLSDVAVAKYCTRNRHVYTRGRRITEPAAPRVESHD